MTNEELAIKIQLGHNEYYTELWQNVRKLMYKILYNKISRLELPNYITAEDMEQELYFALCNTVQAYDDTKPYKFNSYLEYQVMRAIRDALPSKPLQEVSYNQTTGDSEDTELLEFIPDNSAADKLNTIELTDIQKLTRQAVAQLPSRERQAITLRYFGGADYKQICKITGVSLNTARERTRKGLHILRQNKAIRSIYDEMERHYSHSENIYEIGARHWEYSAERREIKYNMQWRRHNGEYISYATEQCTLYIAMQRYIKAHYDEFKMLCR